MRKSIYCVIGKSASGKDRISREIARIANLYVMKACTTRPMRVGEREGNPYHFITDSEEMMFPTSFSRVDGTYVYGFVKEEMPKDQNILVVANIEQANQIMETYSKDYDFVLVLMEASEEQRMLHAIDREENPDYAEICRRFQTDAYDFSFENPAYCNIYEKATSVTSIFNDYEMSPTEIAEEFVYTYMY